MYAGIVPQKHVEALRKHLSTDENVGRVMAEMALRDPSTRPGLVKLLEGGKLTADETTFLPYTISGARLDRALRSEADDD